MANTWRQGFWDVLSQWNCWRWFIGGRFVIKGFLVCCGRAACELWLNLEYILVRNNDGASPWAHVGDHLFWNHESFQSTMCFGIMNLAEVWNGGVSWRSWVLSMRMLWYDYNCLWIRMDLVVAVLFICKI